MERPVPRRPRDEAGARVGPHRGDHGVAHPEERRIDGVDEAAWLDHRNEPALGERRDLVERRADHRLAGGEACQEAGRLGPPRGGIGAERNDGDVPRRDVPRQLRVLTSAEPVHVRPVWQIPGGHADEPTGEDELHVGARRRELIDEPEVDAIVDGPEKPDARLSRQEVAELAARARRGLREVPRVDAARERIRRHVPRALRLEQRRAGGEDEIRAGEKVGFVPGLFGPGARARSMIGDAVVDQQRRIEITRGAHGRRRVDPEQRALGITCQRCDAPAMGDLDGLGARLGRELDRDDVNVGLDRSHHGAELGPRGYRLLHEEDVTVARETSHHLARALEGKTPRHVREANDVGRSHARGGSASTVPIRRARLDREIAH